MLYDSTLSEISNNINTGVEYEIALFYKLLQIKPNEQEKVFEAFNSRFDANKIKGIISQTDITPIQRTLNKRNLHLDDVSFETQNDTVGPADIVMFVRDGGGIIKIGLSVKYANTCTLNVTGRNFITDVQISELKNQLPAYTQKYIQEMTEKYGDVGEWFRKRKPSKTTDAYIDLIRDAVIDNWGNVRNKTTLLEALFHSDSPIEFWVVTYGDSGFTLKSKPQTIDISRANDVTVGKYQTSYVAFYLDGKMVGHMQVKFNNGFVEKCKKKTPDIIHQGVSMVYGQPFSSWNFSVEK
ncbi:MAG: hypothetical protein IJU90_02395 [Bacteroidales bacterium]|nr:hypothetical protein [Bacteroidales bacterium]